MSGTTGYAAQAVTEITGQDPAPAGVVAQAVAEVTGQDPAPPGAAGQLVVETVAASWYQWAYPLAFTTVQAAPERPFPLGFKDYPPPPLVARFGATGPFL
jgi:hypothetical protein